jgi:hypothetical protein
LDCEIIKIYGISQDPNTTNYFLVQNNINWISGNKKIDDFIKEIQLKVESHHGIVFEWIPYNQLENIKETGKNGFMTIYAAIWKDGPLYYDKDYNEYMRNLNKEVALKCLHNLQNPIEFLTDEVYHFIYILMFL